MSGAKHLSPNKDWYGIVVYDQSYAGGSRSHARPRTLKGTRFYEGVLERSRKDINLKIVKGTLRRDFSIQEIAETFEMDLEEVREIARQFS